jgi:DNA-binding NarL/FixJ family response regulator
MQLQPTGALVDVLLPDGSGFDLAATLERALPGIAVLVMSTHDHDGTAHARAESCGARGFVLKSQLASCDLGAFLPLP